MSFLINEAFLPATLTVHPMGDEEFASFCADHPDLNFELTAEGELIVMAPAHSGTGTCKFEIVGQLRNWAKKDRRGIGCSPPPASFFPMVPAALPMPPGL